MTDDLVPIYFFDFGFVFDLAETDHVFLAAPKYQIGLSRTGLIIFEEPALVLISIKDGDLYRTKSLYEGLAYEPLEYVFKVK